jgi:hypothetical protein
MAITIQCDQCKTSDGQYLFKDVSFSYIDEKNYSKGVHLCGPCQAKLENLVNGTIAEFLKEKLIRDWSKHKGVW